MSDTLRLLTYNIHKGYCTGNRRFVLQRVVKNQGLSTSELRSALTDLGSSVAQTYAHWSVANWTSQPANSASAPSRTAAAPSTQRN